VLSLTRSVRCIMFEKDMRISFLLDFYSDALDGHTASVMRAYYNDDLSLSEIASGEGISRQGIRHLIKKGEEQINFLEDKLGLARRYTELSECAASLSQLSASLEERGLLTEKETLDSAIKIILKGN